MPQGRTYRRGQSEATLTVLIALSRTGILAGNAKQELARTGRVVLRVCSTLFPHCKPSAVGSSHCSFQFWELLLEVAEHSLARGGITAGFSGPVLRLPKRNGKEGPKTGTNLLERPFPSLFSTKYGPDEADAPPQRTRFNSAEACRPRLDPRASRFLTRGGRRPPWQQPPCRSFRPSPC